MEQPQKRQFWELNWSGDIGAEEENLKEFFEERTSGKLILMTDPSVAITRTDNKIQVTAMVQKGRFELEVRQRAVIVNPEEKIRWIK